MEIPLNFLASNHMALQTSSFFVYSTSQIFQNDFMINV